MIRSVMLVLAALILLWMGFAIGLVVAVMALIQ